MYAVIKTGGKQYRVKAGDLLVVEKLDGATGDNVSFDQVLMLGEGEQVVVGAPIIAGAVVAATLIETRKGDKIKVFKKIRRQGYRRTGGHRQIESVVRVTGISGEGLSESWDGVVDLTPRSVLNARARNLKIEAAGAPRAVVAAPQVEEIEAPEAVAVAEAPVKATKAKAAKPKAEAAPAAGQDAPAPKAKKAAKPKTDEA